MLFLLNASAGRAITIVIVCVLILMALAVFSGLSTGYKRGKKDKEAEMEADRLQNETLSKLTQEVESLKELSPREAIDKFETLAGTYAGADELFFDSGISSYDGEERFSVVLMRKFTKETEEGKHLSFVLGYYFPVDEENAELKESLGRETPEVLEEERVLKEFFENVRQSRSYAYLLNHAAAYTEAKREETEF